MAKNDSKTEVVLKSGRIIRTVLVSLCLLMLIAIWVGTGLFLQTSGIPVWFMVYISHSWYICCLVPWFIWCRYRKIEILKSYAWRRNLVTAFVLSFVYLICGGTWYWSLPQTSLSANTAIYNSTCIFVFFLSLVILKEPFRILSFFAVLASIAGVALISVFRRKGEIEVHESVEGYILVLISTLFYGIYEVLYSKMGDMNLISTVVDLKFDNNRKIASFPKNDESKPLLLNDDELAVDTIDVNVASPECIDITDITDVRVIYITGQLEKDVFQACLCLGLIGLIGTLYGWIFLLIFHYTGIELLIWPTAEQWIELSLLGSTTALYDILLLICIDLTSPLYVSVGTMLTIPTSVVVDYLVKNYHLSALAYTGILLITCGFVLLTFSERRNSLN